MKLTVEQIATATSGEIIGRGPGAFDGVGTDSRTIVAGSLFVPIVGDRFDGHDFIGGAVGKGASGFIYERNRFETEKVFELTENGKAAAISVEDTLRALGDIARFARDLIEGMKVVAITGSTGKSTTKEMTASVLAESMTVAKNTGNLNNLVGLPQTILAFPERVDAAVVELGTNTPGEIERLAYVSNPDVACVTNVGPVHLEGLGSIEGVAIEKGALPRSLGAEQVFVVNCDDDRVAAMAAQTPARLVCHGLKSKPLADCSEFVTARDVKEEILTTRAMLVTGKGETAIEIHAPGMHNLLNALAAAAIGRSFGLSNEAIARGLGKWRPLEMRSEVRRFGRGVTAIVDCYNSNPASLGAALNMMATFAGRKVAVIGDMLELGVHAEGAHIDAGRDAAEAGIELLVAVGGMAQLIKKGYERRANVNAEFVGVSDAGAAARPLLERLRDNDVVLFKGSRGIRLEEVVEAVAKELGGEGEGA